MTTLKIVTLLYTALLALLIVAVLAVVGAGVRITRRRTRMAAMIPTEQWTRHVLDSYQGDARKAREHVIRLISYHKAALARCEAAQFDLDTLLAPLDETYILYK